MAGVGVCVWGDFGGRRQTNQEIPPWHLPLVKMPILASVPVSEPGTGESSNGRRVSLSLGLSVGLSLCGCQGLSVCGSLLCLNPVGSLSSSKGLWSEFGGDWSLHTPVKVDLGLARQGCSGKP